MTTDELPRLIPTGTCWCGCGKETGMGSYFAVGHDKLAEAALIAAEFGSSVPQLLHKFGYGPGRPVIEEAVRKGNWISCTECWYRGTRQSVGNHWAKYHAPPKD